VRSSTLKISPPTPELFSTSIHFHLQPRELDLTPPLHCLPSAIGTTTHTLCRNCHCKCRQRLASCSGGNVRGREPGSARLLRPLQTTPSPPTRNQLTLLSSQRTNLKMDFQQPGGRGCYNCEFSLMSSSIYMGFSGPSQMIPGPFVTPPHDLWVVNPHPKPPPSSHCACGKV
jgi:hypothetical protein